MRKRPNRIAEWVVFAAWFGFLMYATSAVPPDSCYEFDYSSFSAISPLVYMTAAILAVLIWVYDDLIGIVGPTMSGASIPTRVLVSVACAGMIVVTYAAVYSQIGIYDINPDKVEKSWSNYLYFSVVSFTTLGYGDFRPCEAARLFAASQALVGLLFSAIVVGLILRQLRLLGTIGFSQPRAPSPFLPSRPTDPEGTNDRWISR